MAKGIESIDIAMIVLPYYISRELKLDVGELGQ